MEELGVDNFVGDLLKKDSRTNPGDFTVTQR